MQGIKPEGVAVAGEHEGVGDAGLRKQGIEPLPRPGIAIPGVEIDGQVCLAEGRQALPLAVSRVLRVLGDGVKACIA